MHEGQKILLINTLYFPNIVGGAEKSVQLLAEALVDKGYHVYVITLNNKNIIDIYKINNVEIISVPLYNIYSPYDQKHHHPLTKVLWHALDVYNIKTAAVITKEIKKIQPAVVHTHNIAGFSVAVWTAAKRLGLPLVHTLRDYYLACPKTTMFANGNNCEKPCLQCQAFSAYKRQASKYVDAVTGVSAFVLQRHLGLGYFSNSKTKVIYNPYGQHPVERKSLPTSKGVRFGFIGAVNRAKGIEHLLAAFEKMPSTSGKLLVAGKGDEEYLRHIKTQYPETPFELLGFIQPADFFSRINVLVVPSLWHDPAPRVVLEAMSYGVPVIGSNRGGIPELIGDAGWVFDPDHPNELHRIMEYLAREPGVVEEYSRRALKRVTAFGVEASVQYYIDVYRSVSQ